VPDPSEAGATVLTVGEVVEKRPVGEVELRR